MKLIEADSGWSKRSRVYLGRKRAARCTFTCARLEELPSLPPCTADLVWVQWTLQYLTDRDVVKCLQALAAGLSDQGLLMIKENRPYGSQRPDRFPARIQPIVVSAEREKERVRAHAARRPCAEEGPHRFFMEVPEGEQGRFDITRPDNHHRLPVSLPVARRPG